MRASASSLDYRPIDEGQPNLIAAKEDLDAGFAELQNLRILPGLDQNIEEALGNIQNLANLLDSTYPRFEASYNEVVTRFSDLPGGRQFDSLYLGYTSLVLRDNPAFNPFLFAVAQFQRSSITLDDILVTSLNNLGNQRRIIQDRVENISRRSNLISIGVVNVMILLTVIIIGFTIRRLSAQIFSCWAAFTPCRQMICASDFLRRAQTKSAGCQPSSIPLPGPLRAVLGTLQIRETQATCCGKIWVLRFRIPAAPA